MPADHTADPKTELRAAMRARRAGLEPEALAAAGRRAVQRLEALPVMAAARCVAAYRAVRGEIPLDALLDGDQSRSYTVPRVVGTDLEFVAAGPHHDLSPGAFGILEPVGGDVVPLAEHHVVLLPVVAFDDNGRRLGQGGGFYDRALESLIAAAPRPRPVLIGVAHEFQRVEQVHTDPWDIALDAVVTEASTVVAPAGMLA